MTKKNATQFVKKAKKNQTPQPPATDALLREAFQLHNKGAFNDAISKYHTLLTLHPTHFDALRLMGLAQFAVNNFNEALTFFYLALDQDKNVASVYVNRAVTLERLQRHPEALSDLDIAQKLDPNNIDCLFNRSNILQALSRPQEAIDGYDRLLVIDPKNIDALFNRGNIQRELKHFEQALHSYKLALNIAPNNINVLFNCANLLNELKQYQEALTYYAQILAIVPHHVQALTYRGNILHILQRFDEALASYDLALSYQANDQQLLNYRNSTLQALNSLDNTLDDYNKKLALDPNNADLLFNKGNVLLAQEKHQEALACYEQALKITPEDIPTLGNYGITLEALHQYEQALKVYDHILTIAPHTIEILANRGKLLNQLNYHSAAIQDFELAVSLDPDNSSIICRYATALKAAGKLEEALIQCNNALLLDPHNETLLFNHGNTLHSLKKYNCALDSYDRSLKIDPHYIGTLSNRGLTLQSLNRYEDALTCYLVALSTAPTNTEVLLNQSTALQMLSRHEEALQSLNAALANDPVNVQTHVNQAMCRLLLGDFDHGWQQYEWREKLPDLAAAWPQFTQERWLGQYDINNKALLVHAEQGMGDIIQFCRYTRELAQRGAQVILMVPPSIAPLMHDLGAAQIITNTNDIPAFDYYCPIMSLPLACKTTLQTIPNTVPYLKSDPEIVATWRKKINTDKKFKVGIVWSGNPDFKNDQHRSIDLQRLFTLQSPDIAFFSLQKEIREKDKNALQLRPDIQLLGDDLTDFAQTAAAIELMDLIISVDTAVAHLAGALGKPVWILLPNNPDWRWLLNTDKSPWYPTARLFRQPTLCDWESVIKQLYTELLSFFSLSDLRSDAVKNTPSTIELLHLGNTLQTQKKFNEALHCYQQILVNSPDNIQALICAGDALCELQQFKEALNYYDAAFNNQSDEIINLIPRYNVVLNALGSADGMFPYYEQALLFSPVNDVLRYNYANGLLAVKKYEEALYQYNLSIRIDPTDVAALNNRGLTLENLNRHNEAVHSYDCALAIATNHPEILINRSNALQNAQRYAEAIATLDIILAIDQNHANANLRKGTCNLLLGNLEQGWPAWEWRWKRPNAESLLPTFTQAKWLNDFPINNKTILLTLEYGIGFGDVIHFYRYVPFIAALGAKVIIVVQAALQNIMQTLQGVHKIITTDDPLPAFDYYCPIQSLPFAFKTTLNTIPNKVPYLTSDQRLVNSWRPKINHHLPNIGLVWSGKMADKNDRNRSIALEKLSPLLTLPANFYCLQTEIRPHDAATMEQHKNLHSFANDLTDFAQTAAVIELMDIVITVDTSVAHLAGALGKPVWLLLPANPDWRWLLNRSDSPWYPSAQLFRQSTLGNWDNTIDHVGAQLSQYLQTARAKKTN